MAAASSFRPLAQANRVTHPQPLLSTDEEKHTLFSNANSRMETEVIRNHVQGKFAIILSNYDNCLKNPFVNVLFHFLPIEDQASFAQVSKVCKHVITLTRNASRALIIRNFSLNYDILKIINLYPQNAHLRIVDIYNTSITDECLLRIVERFPNLEILNLQVWYLLTVACFQYIAQLKNLRELRLKYFSHKLFDDFSFLQLSILDLRALCLNMVEEPRGNFEERIAIVLTLFKHLTELDLTVRDLTKDICHALSKLRLQNLAINRVYIQDFNYDKKALVTIINCQHDLKSFYFQALVNEEILAQLSSNCPNLEDLSIGIDDSKPDAALDSLTLPKLKKLSLDFLRDYYSKYDNLKIDNQRVNQLISRHPKLEYLSLRFFFHLNHTFFACIADKLPFLTTLDISIQREKDFGFGLAHLSRHEMLNSLRLHDCSIEDQHLKYLQGSKIRLLILNKLDITDEGIQSLSKMPHLKKITVTRCTGVTMDGVKKLKESMRKSHPGLQILFWSREWPPGRQHELVE